MMICPYNQIPYYPVGLFYLFKIHIRHLVVLAAVASVTWILWALLTAEWALWTALGSGVLVHLF